MAEDVGVANGLASEDMDNATHCSVVLHVDLDCFYAAVEQVRLGIPRETPLAVQQWRGLIAINYAARAAGVTRLERADQALKKCPELKLVHVETIGEEGGNIDGPDRRQAKVSLERYRRASASVFTIFRRFSDVYEKASIDEAYLDVTAKVEEMTNESCDWAGELQRLTEKNEQGCSTMVVLESPLIIFNAYDRRMLAGAIIADKIRASVRNELGYTCSVGIASNKLLAKIASAKNKPDRQTVIPPRAVASLMQTMPLKKMRLLGGKLGQELTQKWGFSTAGEAQALPLTTLVSCFGDRLGNYVWNAVRGIQAEKVQAKQVPKSMLAAKSFAPIKELPEVRRWLWILAEELAVRMLRDFQQNHRHPRHLQLYYRSGGFKHAKDHSKSWSMPHGALSLLSSSSVSSEQIVEASGQDKDVHPEDELKYTTELVNDEQYLQLVADQQESHHDPDMSVVLGEDQSEGVGLIVTERSKAIARVLEDSAFTMFKRLDGTFPCTRLALAASGFQELGAPGMKSIQQFFSSSGGGTSETVALQNGHKNSSGGASSTVHGGHNSNSGGSAFAKENGVKSVTRKATTPEKPRGILKYMHQSHLIPNAEEYNVVSSNSLPEKTCPIISIGASRHDTDGLLEEKSKISVDAKDSLTVGRAEDSVMPLPVTDVSVWGVLKPVGDIPDPLLDQEHHLVAEDKILKRKIFCSEESPQSSFDSNSKRRHSSVTSPLRGNVDQESNMTDNVDLRKVDMKEQARILAHIRHSGEQSSKVDRQQRGVDLQNFSKRPRSTRSSAGQQTIGKFFHKQGYPSKDTR